jgi:hypothetical protein
MKNVFFILVTSSCFLFTINLKNQSKNQFVVAQEVTGIHFNGCNGENPQATGALVKVAFQYGKAAANVYGKAALQWTAKALDEVTLYLGATEDEESGLAMNNETEQILLLKKLN